MCLTMSDRKAPVEVGPALEAAADRVGAAAKSYVAPALAIFAIITAALIWEAVGEPLVSALTSNGYYTLKEAAGHIIANLIGDLPTLFLLWGAWELNRFIRTLADSKLWTPAPSNGLFRLGLALVAAGVVAGLVSPILLGIYTGQSAAFQVDPLQLTVLGIGVLLLLVSRLFELAVRVAIQVDQENSQFL